jgi:hypothetical protein
MSASKSLLEHALSAGKRLWRTKLGFVGRRKRLSSTASPVRTALPTAHFENTTTSLADRRNEGGRLLTDQASIRFKQSESKNDLENQPDLE